MKRYAAIGELKSGQECSFDMGTDKLKGIIDEVLHERQRFYIKIKMPGHILDGNVVCMECL